MSITASLAIAASMIASQANSGDAPLPPLITSADYPAAALRAGEEGTVRFQLTVSPGGGVSDCVVIATSGSPSLDAATCRIMRMRARFKPARDEQGRAVEDRVEASVRWTIAKEPAVAEPLADVAAGPSR